MPEARLNLVIHYLRNDDIKEAYELLKDIQPAVPQEYILKGVVNAALGQEVNSVSILFILLCNMQNFIIFYYTSSNWIFYH